jgi:hypothetical protein
MIYMRTLYLVGSLVVSPVLWACAPSAAARRPSPALAEITGAAFEACFRRTLRPTWLQDFSGPIACGTAEVIAVTTCTVLVLQLPLDSVGVSGAVRGTPVLLLASIDQDEAGRLTIEFGPERIIAIDSAGSNEPPTTGACGVAFGATFQGRGRDEGAFGIRGDWRDASVQGKFWLIRR